VYAHFSESLAGLATIRAYGQSERFTKDFFCRVDANSKAYVSIKVADRWLSVRLELLGSICAGLAAVFASNVAVATSSAASGLATGSSFASLAGLSLTYAISVTGLMNWTVRSFANLEAAMNASERVLYYSEKIPQEAPSTSELLENHVRFNPSDPSSSNPSAFAVAAAGGSAIHLSSSWPDQGAITFNNLYMRYRKETPVVLKGLNVNILAGEKVGIVGRTGSGKSSLLMSLMRLVEPELSGEPKDYQPPIQIDGVDCLRIGLKELRSKIGIVPQNPVLFEGTLRSNLDPFDEYSDGEIWNALEGCGMLSTVKELGFGLMAEVTEYGGNWSQGQRQLLCLGRALLRKCTILLLDEATSSLDIETDQEIQKTIRTAFADNTVLTIAHRINTVRDSDKILVMDNGRAAEFSSPKDLLADPSSLFFDIVRHAKAEGKN
jgi:ATP-binding cassette subfamily C (CFTR/MRP) protein 1